MQFSHNFAHRHRHVRGMSNPHDCCKVMPITRLNAQARQAAPTPDLHSIENQISALRELVLQQDSMLKKQQELILRQEAQIEQLQERSGHANGNGNGRRLVTPFEAQSAAGYGDRRLLGLFDARFHSTSGGATPKDYRVLPERIILVRHAESEGNVDNTAYAQIPDSQVPLTEKGAAQARAAGMKIKQYIESLTPPGNEYNMFFYTSPYKRSLQTYEHIISAFPPHRIMGVQEEVQLREQDFGNFQDPEGKQREQAERLRFGRFYYRFPDGESGADVYDRLTIFEDHLIRDINAGRYSGRMNLVLVTHGLALRIFLMRWFHWTVDQFLNVYNPPNAEPLILERIPNDKDAEPGGSCSWVHTKALYRLTPESRNILRGCTLDMCMTDHLPRRPAAISSLVQQQHQHSLTSVNLYLPEQAVHLDGSTPAPVRSTEVYSTASQQQEPDHANGHGNGLHRRASSDQPSVQESQETILVNGQHHGTPLHVSNSDDAISCQKDATFRATSTAVMWEQESGIDTDDDLSEDEAFKREPLSSRFSSRLASAGAPASSTDL